MMHGSPRSASGALSIIVLAELFATSLWFSVNAVGDALALEWGIQISDLGHLTSAVQLGFICGTLSFALTGFADRFSSSRLFAVSALAGALLNAVFILTAGNLSWALASRFAVGFSLAGIYPLGMKMIMSWAPQKAGMALGWLVGMLTLGTGLSHLLRGLAFGPDWHFVLYAASLLAVLAAIMIWRLGDGPHHLQHTRLQWGKVLQGFQIPRFRAAALGYFGHMWELYAFWALVPVLMAQVLREDGRWVPLAAFGVFAAGALGCIIGGMLSRTWGSARIAVIALGGSGLFCLVYPLMTGLAPFLALLALFIWGALVVADSPQFSALAARACDPGQTGSTLALMNSIGFAISILSIELTTYYWESLSTHVIWLLVPGPVLGLLAMRYFRHAAQ